MAAVSAMGVAGASAAPSAHALSIRFHAHFVATETMTPDLTCGGFRVGNTGSGAATALGMVSWRATSCADLLAEPGRLRARDGRAVISDSHGDSLRVSYEGRGDLPDLAGNVHVSGPFTITGGSGRLSGATGGGTVTGDGNIHQSDATVDVVGVLSFPP
jgi:hypothetical protein